MALTRKQKEEQVALLTERLKRAKSVSVIRIAGQSVKDSSEFRRRLRAHGAEKVVAKKTLFRIASKQAGLPELPGKSLEGSIALVMSYDDPVSGPKVVKELQQIRGGSEFLAGYIADAAATSGRIAELASMFNKTECYAKIASLFRSPLVSFAFACRSPLLGFARGLQEVSKQRQPSNE